MLTLKITNGVPAIWDKAGKILFSDLRVGVTLPGHKSNSHDVLATGSWTLDGDESSGTAFCHNAKIEYRREGNGLAMRSFYTYDKDPTPRSEKLIGLWGMWHCGFEKCLLNDFTTANGTLVNEMRSQVVTARFMANQTLSGAETMALVDTEGTELIAGYVTFNHRFPCLDAGDEGKIVFWQQTENHPIATGETLVGDWIYLGICEDIRTGLSDYARLAAKYMNSRAGIFDTPYGYCTWYYYGRGLCPQTVYENMETLARNRHRIGAKYFNLDNGWFKEWGDWTENEKFTCGMKKIADDIRAQGYIPGIWLAPFGGFPYNKFFAEHPDWFVRRWDSDEPYIFEGRLSLDMSHPEVKEFITETFRRITYDWGYRHVKIDIITDTLSPGRHYDPAYTSLMNYREGLRLIREAMTEDTVLLACTAPMGPSIGYADGMRTSGDIFHDWTCLKGLFNENLKRYYFNNIWFCNDPDCLLVRTSKNEEEDCIRPCNRTDAENRTFATVVMATGGAMIMSDKLPLLEEYQLKLLSYMYPINKQAAIPLDLMESNVPSILYLGKRHRTDIYALVNWSDAARTLKIPANNGHVFEFWTQSYRGMGCDSFEIEPHGARIVLVTDPAPVAAIGADDCLCPEIEQEYADGELSGRFVKPGETLTLFSEKPIAEVSGGELIPHPASPSLYTLTQKGDDLNFRVRTL